MRRALSSVLIKSPMMVKLLALAKFYVQTTRAYAMHANPGRTIRRARPFKIDFASAVPI
jgi:hypothetical protein